MGWDCRHWTHASHCCETKSCLNRVSLFTAGASAIECSPPARLMDALKPAHCSSEFGMRQIQAFSIILFGLTPLATFAQAPVNQAEIEHCRAITDDRQRLRCFDDLFSAARSEPAGSADPNPKSAWSIIEDKSATDDSAQFSAGIVVGDTALILRCREQKTEAAFSTKDTYLGEESVKVRYRIDLNERVQQVWRSSMNGRAAFAPYPIDFIRALPDNGRIFVRATAADGNNKDVNFILAGTSAIRDKIARACHWPDTSEGSVGSVHPPQAR